MNLVSNFTKCSRSPDSSSSLTSYKGNEGVDNYKIKSETRNAQFWHITRKSSPCNLIFKSTRRLFRFILFNPNATSKINARGFYSSGETYWNEKRADYFNQFCWSEYTYFTLFNARRCYTPRGHVSDRKEISKGKKAPQKNQELLNYYWKQKLPRYIYDFKAVLDIWCQIIALHWECKWTYKKPKRLVNCKKCTQKYN